MLSKKERLKKADFNRFFSIGRRYHHELFMLVHSPYPTLHASVVVPKKIEGSAVKRNKIRRRLYDALKHVAMRESVQGVYILIANKKTAGASFKDLTEGFAKQIGGMNKAR